jgi:hypothetical protein
MKKEEKRYTVICHYTRDTIESIGCDRWVRKNFKWLIIGFVVFFGDWILVTTFTNKNSMWQWLAVIPLFISPCYAVFKMYRYGKAFYNKVKDLSEPIDLSTIK